MELDEYRNPTHCANGLTALLQPFEPESVSGKKNPMAGREAVAGAA